MNKESMNKESELVRTFFKCVSLFLRHSFGKQREALFAEFHDLNNRLREAKSGEVTKKLVEVFSEADSKLIKLLRLLFAKCNVRDFCAGIHKYVTPSDVAFSDVTLSYVSEDIISNLKNKL